MSGKVLLPVLVSIVLPAASQTYNDRPYYPYSAPYRYYGVPQRADTDREIARIRRELRRERALEKGQLRQQEQELNLLRQQAMANHRISAQQACYYRTTGGFELCADLFTEETQEFSECEALVVQRNPSCNYQPLTETGNNNTD